MRTYTLACPLQSQCDNIGKYTLPSRWIHSVLPLLKKNKHTQNMAKLPHKIWYQIRNIVENKITTLYSPLILSTRLSTVACSARDRLSSSERKLLRLPAALVGSDVILAESYNLSPVSTSLEYGPGGLCELPAECDRLGVAGLDGPGVGKGLMWISWDSSSRRPDTAARTPRRASKRERKESNKIIFKL